MVLVSPEECIVCSVYQHTAIGIRELPYICNLYQVCLVIVVWLNVIDSSVEYQVTGFVIFIGCLVVYHGIINFNMVLFGG